MRINPFKQNLTNYKTKRQAMPLAASCLTVQTNVMRPSIPFTGGPLHVQVKNVVLPSLLQNMDGEFYLVNIFDKIKKQKVNAFLRYATNKSKKYLDIFDKKGEKIGSTNMEFSDWEIRKLPKNYLRLHNLESTEKESYAGVGSTIIQAAIEQSLKTDAKGRIYVYAWNALDKKNDPFVFYNKMGLSVTDPHSNFANMAKYHDMLSAGEFESLQKMLNYREVEDIEANEHMLKMYEAAASARNCRLDEIYLDFVEYMYLHDNKIKDLWLPKIKANPVFCESHRLK